MTFEVINNNIVIKTHKVNVNINLYIGLLYHTMSYFILVHGFLSVFSHAMTFEVINNNIVIKRHKVNVPCGFYRL